jgi:hypothetical protein
MQRRLLVILLIAVIALPCAAQKISIGQFKRVKFDLATRKVLPVDKKMATLDLKTDEKGFTFKADGKTPIAAQEGDGQITLLAPHKTAYLLVEHPDYGQLMWKVPGKGLRKKKHYRAIMQTDKPGKEYKLSKQWVVFQVIPENAILQVDSTVALVRNGLAQFHLPLGKHGYHVEAPFYEELSDTVEVVDSAKIVVPVVLQSVYSYLTVKLPVLEGHIYVDGQPIGKGEATSGRLQPGDHQVLVTQNETCYVDTVVNLGIGEKRVLTLQASDMWVRPLMARAVTPGVLKEAADSTVTDSTAMAANVPLDSLKAQVTITAPDEETQIWLNREPLAYGKWEGKLALGFYIVSTLKEGLESKPIFLYVDDTLPKVLDMSLPKASYGVLNIHSNVVGATIILNQVEVGITPCILENLPATVACRIVLKKEGYHDAKLTVMPVPNDMLDVELNMKPDN